MWIDVARRHSVPIRFVLFTAGTQICEHNDAVRALNYVVCYSLLCTILECPKFSLRLILQMTQAVYVKLTVSEDEPRKAFNSSRPSF